MLPVNSGITWARVVSVESILSHSVFFKDPEFCLLTSPSDAKASESIALFLTPLIVWYAAICDKDVDTTWKIRFNRNSIYSNIISIV